MDPAYQDNAHADLVANLAWVRRRALAIVRDETLADDLAQEVARAALQHSPQSTRGSIEALRGWLSTVAHRLALDRIRSESARRMRERTVSRPEADDASAEVVERVVRSQRVVQAVMQLSEPQRSTVLLRCLDHLPMAEVARLTGVSESTARKRLAAGLKALRSKLDREFGTGSKNWAVLLLAPHGAAISAKAASHPSLLAVLKTAITANLNWLAAGVSAVIVGLTVWSWSAVPDVGPSEVSSAAANMIASELPTRTSPAPASPVLDSGKPSTGSDEGRRELAGIQSPPVESSPAGGQKSLSIGSAQVWDRINGVSAALFSGTANLEDVCGLSKSLLSMVDEKSASKSADGVIVYRLGSDSEQGSAALVVNPNRLGKIDQYELSVDMTRISGYNGNAQDVEGSHLQIDFGDVAKGKWSICAHVEDRLRTRVDAVWSGNAYSGKFPIGGTLFCKENDVYWRQETAETTQLPDGKPAWKIGYEPEKTRLVKRGGFSSDSLAEIQAVLSVLSQH